MSDLDAERAFLEALSTSRRTTPPHGMLFGALLVARIVRACGRDDAPEWRIPPLLAALRAEAETPHLGENARLLLGSIAADAGLAGGRLAEDVLRSVMQLAQCLRAEGHLRCAHALLRIAAMDWPLGVAPHLQLECTYRLMQLELRGASTPVDGRRHARLLARHARSTRWPEGRFYALVLLVDHCVRVGNLPRATRVVAALAAEAASVGGVYHRQVADLHAAVIAGRGGDPVGAARSAAKVVFAGGGLDQLVMRDAALILGEATMDLGFATLAMQCFGAVAAATDDGVQRGIALVGLLAATARGGSCSEFVTVCERVREIELLAIHRVDALVNEARGRQRFGETARAREALHAARALAEKYRLHQDSFEIESALTMMTEPTTATPRSLRVDLSRAVEQIVSTQRGTVMTR